MGKPNGCYVVPCTGSRCRTQHLGTPRGLGEGRRSWGYSILRGDPKGQIAVLSRRAFHGVLGCEEPSFRMMDRLGGVPKPLLWASESNPRLSRLLGSSTCSSPGWQRAQGWVGGLEGLPVHRAERSQK